MRALYQGVDFMCNSQFLFWELKDEKFVRDDSSEPSGPNQISGDSPHRARPHPGTLDLAHAAPRPRMRTQVLFRTSLAPNLAQLPHPVFGSTMQLSNLLSLKTPVPLPERPATSHAPRRGPQALPVSLPQALQATLLRDPFPDPGPHHRQGHRLAVREAIQGLAHRVVLVRVAAAKLEGWAVS